MVCNIYKFNITVNYINETHFLLFDVCYYIDEFNLMAGSWKLTTFQTMYYNKGSLHTNFGTSYFFLR